MNNSRYMALVAAEEESASMKADRDAIYNAMRERAQRAEALAEKIKQILLPDPHDEREVSAEWQVKAIRAAIDAARKPTPCDHDKRFTGVFDLPKGTNGCLACAYEKALSDLTAAQEANAKLKAHAEAMANGVEGKVYYANSPDVCEAVDAYRRDFPRTP